MRHRTAGRRCRNGARRGGAVAGSLLVSMTVAGCGPLVTVAASVLSGVGRGGGPSTSATGPMSGAPSTTQNGTPRDRSIRDVLDHVDNQDIEDRCTEQLPPEADAPITQCVMRPTCLPGMKYPIEMRVCPAIETASKDGGPRKASAVALDRHSDAATAWRWEETP